jgi:hypothetical protein
LTPVNVFYLSSELIPKDRLDKLNSVMGNRFVGAIDPEFDVNSVERYKLLVGLTLVNRPVMVNGGDAFRVRTSDIPSLYRYLLLEPICKTTGLRLPLRPNRMTSGYTAYVSKS